MWLIRSWWHELDDEFRALRSLFEFRSVEIPSIAASIQKYPAMVCLSVDPGLNRIGNFKCDLRRIGSNLAERKAVLMTRRFQAIGRYRRNEAVPCRGAIKRNQHAVQIHSVALVKGAHQQLGRANGRPRRN